MTTMFAAIVAPLAVVALLVYATMRGLRATVSLGARPPAAAEVTGRPGEEAPPTASRRDETPLNAKVQRWFDALFLIAQDGCAYRDEGSACYLLPDLATDGVPWCPACRAYVALNPQAPSLPVPPPGSEVVRPEPDPSSDGSGRASNVP